MAKESVEDYLRQIFNDRRYCSECGAMTPILYLREEWIYSENCEICFCEFEDE